MRSELHAPFEATLKPMLDSEGFQPVHLDACMKNEQLWRRGRLWFGVSFDWRDRYFEANLGHLYWFRDVMPRVIVLGNYAAFANFDPMKKFEEEALASTLEAIRDSFSTALAKYELHYPEILKDQLDPKKGRYAKEYFAALGAEVQNVDLQPFLA